MDFSKLIQAEIAKRKAQFQSAQNSPNKTEGRESAERSSEPVPSVDSKKRELEERADKGTKKARSAGHGNSISGDDESVSAVRHKKLAVKELSLVTEDQESETNGSSTNLATETTKPAASQDKKLDEQERIRGYEREERETEASLTIQDIRDHRKSTYLKMRACIRQMLDQWQDSIETQEDHGPHYKLLLEVVTDLQPLFRLLRQENLPENIYPTLATLLLYIRQRNFNRAHETYHALSIGNSAWPIGVISVGMHERTSDAKLIGGSANIIKDESTRRWILSVKRLLSFAERSARSDTLR
jgi:pre-mRNA-splicing factor 18